MSLGMPEIMIIMVIALIVFGPRKLPELGKSIGQALAQFRRASDDFKRTWEQEVDLEKTRNQIESSSLTEDSSSSDTAHSSYSEYNPDGSYNYGYESSPDYVSGSEQWQDSSANASVTEESEAINATGRAADESAAQAATETASSGVIAGESSAKTQEEKSWI
jgi:TatA/E family protein of Tat protein translocase